MPVGSPSILEAWVRIPPLSRVTCEFNEICILESRTHEYTLGRVTKLAVTVAVSVKISYFYSVNAVW